MLNNEQAFYNAFQASPEDEAPRKIFADWLDEHGRHEEATYYRRWTYEIELSKQWLEIFASKCGSHCTNYNEVVDSYFKPGESIVENWTKLTFDDIIRIAKNFIKTCDIDSANEWGLGGEQFIQFGQEGARDHFYETPELFWKHFKTYTGLILPWEKEDFYPSTSMVNPFTCSC